MIVPGFEKRQAKKLSEAVSVADVRELARKRLPRMIFDYIEGGAEDEVTLRANSAAFDRIRFQPSALNDVSSRSLTTSIAGMPMAAPIVMAPAGLTRIVHPDGELAVAIAAGRAKIPYVITPWSAFTIEELATSAPGPLWLEVNPMADTDLLESLIGRADDAGFSALVYMVDSPVGGRRERELRRRLIPPRYTLRNVLDAAVKPSWSLGFTRTAHLLAPRNLPGSDFPRRFPPQVAPFPQFGPKISSAAGTWVDLKRVRDMWNKPLAVKGVMSAGDATRSVDAGAEMVVVSNHGGRQLDGLPATIDLLPEIVEAVGGRADVLIDGGIHRGTQIAKAIALGASGCLIGRAYHYGLAVAGEAGVDRIVQMLSDELDRTLGLLGCQTIQELDRSRVRAIHGQVAGR